MPRRFYRKSVKVTGRSNWSHENKGCAGTIAEQAVNGLYQGGAIVVPSITTQGTRTVGNFTITVPFIGTPTATDSEIYWALVYIPQGESAKNLFATTGSVEGSLYEPNQYVMASGISDAQAGPIRIRSRIMRKLHSGDFISLVIGMTNSNVASFKALVSYSIKYN